MCVWTFSQTPEEAFVGDKAKACVDEYNLFCYWEIWTVVSYIKSDDLFIGYILCLVLYALWCCTRFQQWIGFCCQCYWSEDCFVSCFSQLIPILPVISQLHGWLLVHLSKGIGLLFIIEIHTYIFLSVTLLFGIVLSMSCSMSILILQMSACIEVCLSLILVVSIYAAHSLCLEMIVAPSTLWRRHYCKCTQFSWIWQYFILGNNVSKERDTCASKWHVTILWIFHLSSSGTWLLPGPGQFWILTLLTCIDLVDTQMWLSMMISCLFLDCGILGFHQWVSNIMHALALGICYWYLGLNGLVFLVLDLILQDLSIITPSHSALRTA